MIVLQDTDMRLKRRRPWARAFVPTALKDYEERIAGHIRQLVKGLTAAKLREQPGIRLDKWFQALTYVVSSIVGLTSLVLILVLGAVPFNRYNFMTDMVYVRPS